MTTTPSDDCRVEPEGATCATMSRSDQSRLRTLMEEIVRLDRTGGPVARHSSRPKNIGAKTQYSRRRFHLLVARQLYELGFRVEKLRNLGSRHVIALSHHWEAQGLSPSTLQNRISHLRTLGKMLGKSNLVPAADQLFDDPASIRRSGATQTDKSWSANNIDLERVVDQAYAIEPHAAVQLLVQLGFGLRFAEAACFRPKEADLGDRIAVHWGAKNGRPREVELCAGEQGERQRAILDLAKAYACKPNGSLIPEGYTLRRWQNRFYYVMKICGVTRKDLGVTPHGLRHQYAAELYEAVSGLARPLSRARAPAEQLGARDHAGRAAVATALGHARLQISNAYLGVSARASAASTDAH